jgi:hypothetical protein
MKNGFPIRYIDTVKVSYIFHSVFSLWEVLQEHNSEDLVLLWLVLWLVGKG